MSSAARGPSPPDEDDEPIVIGEEHLERRVDLERGMSPLPVVALALIALTAAVHVVVSARAAPVTAPDWVVVGAKHTPSILAGEVWRLVSPALLHGGWGHLVGNALALYVLGVGCEHAFGRARMLGLFVATAVAGSLVSMLDARPSVGASGAVFGLMGALGSLVLVRRHDLHVRDKRVGVVLFVWAAWSLTTGALDPMIDNLAHLGGFVAGCVLGALTRPAILPWHPAPSRSAGVWIGAASLGALGWALLAVLSRVAG